MIIKSVKARAIKDSRDQPTIEVSVNNGPWASSPSGKSTGAYESKPYYKDLKTCISFLNSFDHSLEIKKFEDLEKVETDIEKKLKLKEARLFGGNALYAFESAILKALAKEQNVALWQVINSRAKTFPRPVGNAIGGGLHSAQFKKHPVFQEFLLVPNEDSFEANVAVMKKIYVSLGRTLGTKKVNDEGAWQAAIDDEEALKLLSEYSSLIDIGVDIAASSFLKKTLYDYQGRERTKPAQREHVISLIKDYRAFYVEDPMEENDFENFATIRKADREAMVVGDDLTATHLDRVKKAIKERSIGGMIIKPNQNGSLLEVKQIVDYCKQHKIQTVFSHRSGETMDDALADYAFGFGANFIKCGIATKWREAKLNRMIEIEKHI